MKIMDKIDKFKNNIEKQYSNVKCILSSENLGMGAGNNLGLKQVKTDYALILNPDVTLINGAISKFFLAIKKCLHHFIKIIHPLKKTIC